MFNGNPMIDPLLGISIFSGWVILLRVGFALAAAFIIGLERSTHNQPAGLRTHMVLALGSSGIMILSMLMPMKFAQFSNNGDPGRMAAQVISGIGFLGGGAILKFGFNVRGLTTAASIWTMSGIGLVFGAGFYGLGGIMTSGLFVILHFMDKIEGWILTKENMRIITVVFNSRDLKIKTITRSIRNFVEVKKLSITENVEVYETELEAHCRIPEDQSIRKLFEHIKGMGDVKSLKIE